MTACLAKGCDAPVSDVYGNACEQHGEVFARIRKELGKREGPKVTRPALPVRTEQLRPHPPRCADGRCSYGCGRKARPGHSYCKPCGKARELVPSCSVDGCKRSSRPDGRCGVHGGQKAA